MTATLPVRIWGHGIESETNHDAAQTSLERVRLWVDAGGQAMNLWCGEFHQRLYGYDVENVVTLARLFMQEHPNWPEPDDNESAGA